MLDEVGGVLVVGDAMGTSGGAVQGSNPQFTADMDAAVASVAKLGTFEFETLLVGHGDPIVSGASDLVAAVPARLTRPATIRQGPRIRQPAACAPRADEERRDVSGRVAASSPGGAYCYSRLGQVQL